MSYMSRVKRAGVSVHRIVMAYCRGPLPEGHPSSGVTYFCADHDVAAGACNLTVTPPVETLRHTSGPCVLLDAHRAPDEWFAIACTMPQLVIQGDPDAMRPRACTAFAAELEKVPAPDAVRSRVHLRCVPRLAEAMDAVRGKHIVLVGSHLDVHAVYSHLRPDGMLGGDTVCDMYGRFAAVSGAGNSSHVFVDDGRRALKRTLCTQHLVVPPSGIRAGEYDTVVVMPGVPQCIGRAVCARCRYMVIAVRHSPFGYI